MSNGVDETIAGGTRDRSRGLDDTLKVLPGVFCTCNVPTSPGGVTEFDFLECMFRVGRAIPGLSVVVCTHNLRV